MMMPIGSESAIHAMMIVSSTSPLLLAPPEGCPLAFDGKHIQVGKLRPISGTLVTDVGLQRIAWQGNTAEPRWRMRRSSRS